MATTLQNEKWQNCIDACMRCAESCEYCATCDLQEQDVKMMINCAQTNRACASVCWTSAQLMSMDSEFAKKFAIFVLMFVTHVLKNVKDIQIWIIVNNVLKPVENVLKNAEQWRVIKELDS
jgi:hypothetical protein